MIEQCPDNKAIKDNIAMAYAIVNDEKYKNIICSVSGGSDSDDMIDIITKVDKHNRVHYVFFDTGLEYQATKEQIEYLENKYSIRITKYKAAKPIPTCCCLYGQPFLSKQVSEFIYRLQKHDFQWEDEPYEELIKKYPRCKSALLWWCGNKGEKSWFNINKDLKKFMIQNPPQFKISNKCCAYAKKKTAKKAYKDYQCDLVIIGIRKAEGGVRASAYKSCFTDRENGIDEYRPLFWYKDADKRKYEEEFGISNSRCYTEYGLKRTGCACCPYGRDFEYELEVAKQHEPKLYKAVTNIFKDSYEYTRKYHEFVKQAREKEENEKDS